jgi:5-oxoprolinase (ATP-hydrolysing)
LSSFGGAGGQHACAIAQSLGITRVFIPRHAGILSGVEDNLFYFSRKF